jgi:hypothetical protein
MGDKDNEGVLRTMVRFMQKYSTKNIKYFQKFQIIDDFSNYFF